MLKTICAVVAVSMMGSFAQAETVIRSTVTSEDLTIEGIGNVATSNAIMLSGYRIMDNNLALIGGFSYITGSVLNFTLSGSTFSAGAGYALSNDLDMEKGTGSTTVLGAQFANTRLEVNNIDASESSTSVGLIGNIALAAGVSAEYAFSSPTDNLGSTIVYSAGISWDTDFFGEIRLGLVGGQSNVDGVDLDTTGWYLGSISRF